MTYLFRITEVPSGEIVLAMGRYGRNVWTLSKITKRLRKDRPCAVCGCPLDPMAYRPITNGNDRMDRICVKCVEEAKEELKA